MDDPKMVPESDLVALKESHARALEKLGVDHAGAIDTLTKEHTGKASGLQSQVNTSTEELSRLRATVTQLEEASKNHTATAEETAGLKTELKAAKDGLKTAEESLGKNLKGHLMAEYKIPEKALENKTIAELTVIRDTLLSVRGPDSSRYTAGGGGGGDPPLKPREKIAAGLEGGDLKPR